MLYGSIEIISVGSKINFPSIVSFNSNLFSSTVNLANGQVAFIKPILAPPVILICP